MDGRWHWAGAPPKTHRSSAEPRTNLSTSSSQPRAISPNLVRTVARGGSLGGYDSGGHHDRAGRHGDRPSSTLEHPTPTGDKQTSHDGDRSGGRCGCASGRHRNQDHRSRSLGGWACACVDPPPSASRQSRDLDGDDRPTNLADHVGVDRGRRRRRTGRVAKRRTVIDCVCAVERRGGREPDRPIPRRR